MGERRPLLRLPCEHLDVLLHLGEPIGSQALDLQLIEHLHGAVLLRLQVEDTERQGAPQHLQMDRANFVNCSTKMCGRNAIFSNYGTYPSWSPYKADKISKAIVYDQGNVFSNNTYVGTWNFTALDTGNLVTPSEWTAAPYDQDAGSSFGN